MPVPFETVGGNETQFLSHMIDSCTELKDNEKESSSLILQLFLFL